MRRNSGSAGLSGGAEAEASGCHRALIAFRPGVAGNFCGRRNIEYALMVRLLEWTPRISAASNVAAGRLEDAHKAMVRLRQLNPALSVSKLGDFLGPYRRAEDLARYEEGLRQAGLPE
jgi:hypothetical protein